MDTISLKPLLHRQQECIGIYFGNQTPLNNAVKKINGCRWTKTHHCWYVALDRANYQAITHAVEGLARVDNTALKAYLNEKKATTGNAPAVEDKKPVAPVGSPPTKKENYQKPISQPPVVRENSICAINAHILPAMRQRLILLAYQPSTIKTYLNEMGQLLQTMGKHSADALTPDDLKRYLVYCFEKLELTENTLHSRINALKFYYEQVLGREKFFWEIPRPKKPNQIPKLFSKEDIQNIIRAISNVKHKTAVLVCYSSGLRVNEVVSLKVNSIDSKRMVINILGAKGKKDRIVPLSKTTLKYLRDYYKAYKPKLYIFEGQDGEKAWTDRSLQKVLERAKKRAGVNKPRSIHALRHSYATHLLDKGVDITYIQKILGHNDLKTTLRYLHVTIRDLSKIESPIEDLDILRRFDNTPAEY